MAHSAAASEPRCSQTLPFPQATRLEFREPSSRRAAAGLIAASTCPAWRRCRRCSSRRSSAGLIAARTTRSTPRPTRTTYPVEPRRASLRQRQRVHLLHKAAHSSRRTAAGLIAASRGGARPSCASSSSRRTAAGLIAASTCCIPSNLGGPHCGRQMGTNVIAMLDPIPSNAAGLIAARSPRPGWSRPAAHSVELRRTSLRLPVRHLRGAGRDLIPSYRGGPHCGRQWMESCSGIA